MVSLGRKDSSKEVWEQFAERMKKYSASVAPGGGSVVPQSFVSPYKSIYRPTPPSVFSKADFGDIPGTYKADYTTNYLANEEKRTMADMEAELERLRGLLAAIVGRYGEGSLTILADEIDDATDKIVVVYDDADNAIIHTIPEWVRVDGDGDEEDEGDEDEPEPSADDFTYEPFSNPPTLYWQTDDNGTLTSKTVGSAKFETTYQMQPGSFKWDNKGLSFKFEPSKVDDPGEAR